MTRPSTQQEVWPDIDAQALCPQIAVSLEHWQTLISCATLLLTRTSSGSGVGSTPCTSCVTAPQTGVRASGVPAVAADMSFSVEAHRSASLLHTLSPVPILPPSSLNSLLSSSDDFFGNFWRLPQSWAGGPAASKSQSGKVSWASPPRRGVLPILILTSRAPPLFPVRIMYLEPQKPPSSWSFQ